MAGKLTRLTHEIALHLHLVEQSCAICSSSSRRPVRKLLDTFSYVAVSLFINIFRGGLRGISRISTGHSPYGFSRSRRCNTHRALETGSWHWHCVHQH